MNGHAVAMTFGMARKPEAAPAPPPPSPTQAALDQAEDVARGNYLRAIFRSAWQMREGVSHECMRIKTEHLERLADEFMMAQAAARRWWERKR